MEGLTLQQICNLIILFSAVIIAVKNIYGFFKKPVDDLNTKAHEKEEKHIEEVIDKKMPDIVQENCNKMMQSLNNIETMVGEQKADLAYIQESIDLLNASNLDLMRYNMNSLYYKYRPYKKILDCDKKAFIKLYNDYHQMGGNTWIDALYNEVLTWEIVEDENELGEKVKKES